MRADDSLPARPHGLRIEHLEEGTPIGVASPRFSWLLPPGTLAQRAWEIEVFEGPAPLSERLLWRSGRFEGADSVLVKPADSLPPITSGALRTWRVRAWTDTGETGWSEPSRWRAGFIAGTRLDAQWIAPSEPETPPAGLRPAYALRRTFEAVDVVSATAFVTAHGIYELFVNGIRVGDEELTPGFTSYRKRLQVQAFDVSELVHAGANVIGVLLSDGWFRGRHGFEREADGFGTTTAAIVQLELERSDGSHDRVASDAGWVSAPSDITSADLMDGESVLPRMGSSWSTVPFDSGGWSSVRVEDHLGRDDASRLVGSVAPPVRRLREVAPVSMTRLSTGSLVVDFGENLNGWVRLGTSGDTPSDIVLTHGEALAPDGTVSTDNIRAFDFATQSPLPAGQVDTVRAFGSGVDVIEPRHTTHGFQYVQVDGHPGELCDADVTAVVVGSDLEPRGGFSCSDDRINRLHAAGERSFVANACDIPTDCPQRERSGFTGDWQVYVDTAAFTHDVAGFSDKWLRDLAADQWASGIVPNIVPNPHGDGPTGAHFTDLTNGSAGWGDAAVIVPWKLWVQYGDRELLERQYPSARAWVEYAATQASGNRHPDRVAAHPEAREHERYLWDTGFHFGEWLEPGVEPSLDPTRDHNEVATGYLAYSARLLAEIARELGRPDESRRYELISTGAARAWQAEQLDADGRLGVQTQAAHVRALAFGLVPAHLVQRVADRLAMLVREADDHLTTGFLSTGLLLPTLADHGHLDTAYALLFSTGYPSWLGMIDAGATTIWERWDGVLPSGRANGSLNHYSKGAVLGFLHNYVAGIRPATTTSAATVGWREFRIAPKPGGGLTSASAFHDGPYGRITSSWTLDSGTFALRVEVPACSTAVVELPDGAAHRCDSGAHEFECSH